MPRTHRVSEELTRKEMIDPQLEKAGWYLIPKPKLINVNNKVNALRPRMSEAERLALSDTYTWRKRR